MSENPWKEEGRMTELSATLKYGKGYEDSWLVIRADNAADLKKAIEEATGLSGEGLSVVDLIHNAASHVHQVSKMGTALGATVIAETLGWGQSRWLLMTSVIFAGNILFNAAFGALGDRVGWTTTVRWFGIVGSAIGLLLWWYVPHWVPAGSDWGFVVSVIAGTVFGILLAGFVPLGAIMPALAPDHKGAAMAMYTTAAGGATFLGSFVVAVVRPWGGNVGVVWAFVVLYALAFLMTFALKVEQPRLGVKDDAEADATA